MGVARGWTACRCQWCQRSRSCPVRSKPRGVSTQIMTSSHLGTAHGLLTFTLFDLEFRLLSLFLHDRNQSTSPTPPTNLKSLVTFSQATAGD